MTWKLEMEGIQIPWNATQILFRIKTFFCLSTQFRWSQQTNKQSNKISTNCSSNTTMKIPFTALVGISCLIGPCRGLKSLSSLGKNGENDESNIRGGVTEMVSHTNSGATSMMGNDESRSDLQWPEYDMLINDLHSSLSERSLRKKKNKGIINEEKVEALAVAYKPIRVTIDFSPLYRKMSKEKTKVLFLINQIVPKALKPWERALRVEHLTEPVDLRALEVNKTGKCLDTHTLPRGGVENTDFYLIVDGIHDRQCIRTTSVAFGGACVFDSPTAPRPYQPRAGSITICLGRIDVSTDEGREAAKTVIMHELGHVFGITSDLFSLYNDPNGEPYGFSVNETYTCGSGEIRPLPAIVGAVNGGKNVYEVTTPKVTQVARNILGCQSVTGARLEDKPVTYNKYDDDDDIEFSPRLGKNFDEQLFYDELMSSNNNVYSNRLSALSLALLEDSGWYMPDYSQAQEVTFGLNAGCYFVQDNVDGCPDPEGNGRGFYCNDDFWSICEPSHQGKAFCNFDDDLDQLGYCPIANRYPWNCKESERCFEIVDGDSLCLETTCDEDAHQVNFEFGGMNYTCSDDFEEVIVEKFYPRVKKTFNHTVTCPRLSSVCPKISSCPGHCAGNGVCDRSGIRPTCVCFDDQDVSKRCDGVNTKDFFPVRAPKKTKAKNENKKKTQVRKDPKNEE